MAKLRKTSQKTLRLLSMFIRVDLVHGGEEKNAHGMIRIVHRVFFTNECRPGVGQVFRKLENPCLREIWVREIHHRVEHGGKVDGTFVWNQVTPPLRKDLSTNLDDLQKKEINQKH